MNTLWTIVGSGAFASIVVAIMGYLGTKKGLDHSQIVTEGTADQLQAEATRTNLTSQREVIEGLRAELTDQGRRHTEAMERRDEATRRLELRVDALTLQVEDLEEQNDQLAAANTRAEDAAKLAREHLKICQRESRELVARGLMLEEWAARRYIERDNDTSDMAPPPKFFTPLVEKTTKGTDEPSTSTDRRTRG